MTLFSGVEKLQMADGPYSGFPVVSSHMVLWTNHCTLQVGSGRSEKREVVTTLPLRIQDHERLAAYISYCVYHDIFVDIYQISFFGIIREVGFFFSREQIQVVYLVRVRRPAKRFSGSLLSRPVMCT